MLNIEALYAVESTDEYGPANENGIYTLAKATGVREAGDRYRPHHKHRVVPLGKQGAVIYRLVFSGGVSAHHGTYLSREEAEHKAQLYNDGHSLTGKPNWGKWEVSDEVILDSIEDIVL